MLRWTGEAEIGTPYWATDGVSGEVGNDIPARCDLLVIGAGYTGLSAALAAHDAGATVCVIDAGQPGAGASTKNGGMVGAHPRFSWDILSARFGSETADNVFAEATLALGWAKDLVERERIECDWQQTGRIQLAWTEKHFENQKRLVQALSEKSEVHAELVARENLSDDIKTEKYFGGIRLRQHAAVNPAKYHDGLVAAVLNRGIIVAGQTPATGWTRVGTEFKIVTPRGAIKASKVILATNGYTPAAFRWHQRRVFPLPSYLIATEQLPIELINELAPGGRMMVETRARHSYFRLSPDGTRILWGGRAAMVPMDLATAAARLKGTMVEVWPELEDVALSHIWTGNTGYSFAHMPHVGEHDGIHYAMGFSGSGTVLAPYLGAKAAYRALGDERGATGYSATNLRTSALHPTSKPYFLYAADRWYRHWVDQWETRKGRRQH